MASHDPLRELLLATRVDRALLARALRGARVSPAMRKLLAKKFDDPDSVRAALAKFARAMPTGGDDEAIVLALAEIFRDAEWAASKRGQLILRCNAAVPALYKAIRGRMGCGDITIRAHGNRQAVVVAGHVGSQRTKAAILAKVQKALKYPVVDKVVVEDVLVRWSPRPAR